jgi:hypothetical protein
MKGIQGKESKDRNSREFKERNPRKGIQGYQFKERNPRKGIQGKEGR